MMAKVAMAVLRARSRRRWNTSIAMRSIWNTMEVGLITAIFGGILARLPFQLFQAFAAEVNFVQLILFGVVAVITVVATAGAYSFTLLVVGVANPDEHYARGPAVHRRVRRPWAGGCAMRQRRAGPNRWGRREERA